MRKFIVLLLIPFLVVQSCNMGTRKSWSDDNINQNLKSQINKLDELVVEAITTNDPDKLKALMSKKLLDNSGDNINQLVHQANVFISNPDYDILNQFYTKNTTTGLGNTLFSGLKGINDYTLFYQALNKEMFVSVIIPDGDHNKYVLTNIYGKYEGGWKLNILQFGQYKANGFTATELFTKAKKEYDKGYLIDAAFDMIMSSNISKPANQLWKYLQEDEMKEFYETVMAEVNKEYAFPLKLDKIDSKPEILNISPQEIDEGSFPMVEYLTKIDLKDTVNTRLENDEIHKSIGEIFKGLDTNKEYIFYKAWNEIPDGKTLKPNYGFVKELKTAANNTYTP